jgi:hypothetical protein
LQHLGLECQALLLLLLCSLMLACCCLGDATAWVWFCQTSAVAQHL